MGQISMIRRAIHFLRQAFRKEWLALTALALLGGRCSQADMVQQPKHNPLTPSAMFADGRSERPVVPGTVAWGRASTTRPDPAFLRNDELLYTGKINGKLADQLPMPLTPQLLARGKERFNIFCAVCHGQTGDGQGMIVLRGHVKPPAYTDPRLLAAPVGHIFDVITNGVGAMYDYRNRIDVPDRWAIVAYVRALQLAGAADASKLPPPDQSHLEAQP